MVAMSIFTAEWVPPVIWGPPVWVGEGKTVCSGEISPLRRVPLGSELRLCPLEVSKGLCINI
jgi:hypothetical protein